MSIFNKVKGEKKKKTVKKKRSFSEGKMKYILTVLAVAMSLFHLYASIVGGITPLKIRSIHLLFVLVIIFVRYPATKKSRLDRPTIVDLVLIILAIISVGHLIVSIPRLAATGNRATQIDIVLGVIIVLLVIEATRRSLGMALPIMAIIILAYGLFGRYVPGPLKHGGFTISKISSYLTLTSEGIFGTVIGVSATYIFLFVLFGAVLEVTGVSKVFNDIALSLAGSRRGGPAKVSVLASGLMGSVSGSTSANVVTTGTFTIPLMQRTGYKDYFASAVEAASSAGGQIMPPVMGSAAFIIADSLGISFAQVLKAAILPAILYYVSVWAMVDLRARREGIMGIPRKELPVLKDVLKRDGYLLLPVVSIIVTLCMGYNAIKAALISMLVAVIVSSFKKETRIDFKKLIKALEKGAIGAVPVAIACAVIGIVVGVISLTGALLAIGSAVLKLSNGILPFALILTMLVAIVLGMGLPTTACYVLTSTIAAPTLVKMGVLPLQAHLFVFYYGILSTITPPVATGAYTAAGLSGADPNKTGWTGIRLAFAGFVIPFMFVYCGELLLPAGVSLLKLVTVIISSIVGVICLAVALEGYWYKQINIVIRVVMFAAAILLINSSVVTDVIGYGIAVAFFVYQEIQKKKGNVDVVAQQALATEEIKVNEVEFEDE